MDYYIHGKSTKKKQQEQESKRNRDCCRWFVNFFFCLSQIFRNFNIRLYSGDQNFLEFSSFIYFWFTQTDQIESKNVGKYSHIFNVKSNKWPLSELCVCVCVLRCLINWCPHKYAHTHTYSKRERERGKDFGIHTLKFVTDCMYGINF